MNHSQKLSVSGLFSVLGGTAAVARALGVGTSTASEMKRRGRIPAEYWRDLLHQARATGNSDVTADLLVELHARKSNKAVPQGFSEPEASTLEPFAAIAESDRPTAAAASGQFSRWKHLRRSHFASQKEIDDHIRALREEWDRR